MLDNTLILHFGFDVSVEWQVTWRNPCLGVWRDVILQQCLAEAFLDAAILHLLQEVFHGLRGALSFVV